MMGGYRPGETRIDMSHLEQGAHHTALDDDHHDDEVFDSKPATRRNSETSSLNDVCFPLDVLDDEEGTKNWPDLAVLEEFLREETERLQAEAAQETSAVNMRYDSMSDADSDVYSGQVGFSYPIVTKVDAPLLGNHRINETETLNGRLRPPKINPFAKKNRHSNTDFLKTINYPPHIINNNPEHFRFTYFREDLDSTVHSPTISGLLQPGQNFADLFDFVEYTKKQSKNPTAPNSIKESSLKEMTPKDVTPKDATPSVDMKPDSYDEDSVSPFWLDVLNPTEEEMKVLSKAFQIHPLTTEDIFLGETREKVELFKDYYFVCFRSFDIVQERAKMRKGEAAKTESVKPGNLWQRLFSRRQSSAKSAASMKSETSTMRRQRKHLEREKYQRKSGEKHKPKNNELEPLNVYIIVFRHAVLTFHFAPTPHPVNVRRRARLLREYLTVSADWIAYALIDDITDAFGPMIESIEDEVNDIEDSILRMHTGNDSSDDDSDDSDDDFEPMRPNPIRKGSTIDARSLRSVRSISTQSTKSINSNVIEWRKKGDLLKRIGETRTRVMALLRLLGSKVDVIKGFAKRCNEQWEVAPRSEIGMYLGDIQDHIVTMVQSLNHYEKLLARSHSNYLAQINIDMTRVNNDMNDVLGKISLLGTVVLPMNIITGLWGMNVLVPGQSNEESLIWFWSITFGMIVFAFCAYIYMKRISGFD
jgi:magnesium transporter